MMHHAMHHIRRSIYSNILLYCIWCITSVGGMGLSSTAQYHHHVHDHHHGTCDAAHLRFIIESTPSGRPCITCCISLLTNSHWSAHFFHGITFQYQASAFQDISRRMSFCYQHSIGTVDCNAMQCNNALKKKVKILCALAVMWFCGHEHSI